MRSSIRLACASLVLTLGLSVAPDDSAGQPIQLPSPRGPYALGTSIMHWVDASRAETAPGHERERRELMVQLWYPAAASTAPYAPYIPDFGRIATHKKELNDRGLALLGRGIDRLERLKTHARLDAPVLAGPARWPVVLFSPGNTVPRSIYTALVEELASHGFVVVAIDHPYSVAIVVLPDGRAAIQAGTGAPVVPFETRVAVRAADLRFALDEMTRLDGADPAGRFAGRLDLAHVGAFGHSLGGVAAVKVSAQDRRFTAVANLDGGTGEMADNLERGGVSPLLLLTKAVTPAPAPTDATLVTWGMSRAQYEDLMAQERATRDRVYAAMTAVAYRVSLVGAQHMNFSDSALLEHDNTGIDAARALTIAADYLVAFFERYLCNRSSALLDGPSPAYPDARWERFPR